MKYLSKCLAFGLIAAVLSSCASIMSGRKQSIGVSSVPSGALVTIDGTAHGPSPVLVPLSRRKEHLIKIEMEGFQPFEIYTKRKYNGWLWGNVVVGGLIGLAIDTATGAIYKITPNRVTGNLIQKTAQKNSDAIYIEAVLTPDPAWEQIGTMKKST